MQRGAVYLLCGLMLSGCVSPMGLHTAGRGLKSSSGAREAPVSGDPWVEDAGSFARVEHTREEVRDPLGLRDFLTSEKARQIERNVGVGD